MAERLLSNNPDEDIAPVSPFGAIDYGKTEAELQAIAEQFSGITEITNREQFDAAKGAVKTLAKERNALEDRRKQLKKESLDFGRLVDSTAKELKAVVEPEHDRIKAMLDAIKAEQEAKRAEAARLEEERVEKRQDMVAAIADLPRQHERSSSADVKAAIDALERHIILETEFDEFAAQASEAKADSMAQLQDLYQGALHDERIAKQEAEQRAKEDAERQAESERLAKERAELDAMRAAQEAEEEEKRKAMEAEQAKRDAELQAERDALAKQQAELRAEQERIEQERKAKEVAEAKAEAEKQRKAAAAKLKPDAEKLSAYVNELLAVAEPVLKTEQAQAHMEQIQTRLSEIKSLANLIDQAA